MWHSNTYRLENTLNYGMERVWCVCAKPGSNNVALGYDDGSIIIQVCLMVHTYGVFPAKVLKKKLKSN